MYELFVVFINAFFFLDPVKYLNIKFRVKSASNKVIAFTLACSMR